MGLTDVYITPILRFISNILFNCESNANQKRNGRNCLINFYQTYLKVWSCISLLFYKIIGTIKNWKSKHNYQKKLEIKDDPIYTKVLDLSKVWSDKRFLVLWNIMDQIKRKSWYCWDLHDVHITIFQSDCTCLIINFDLPIKKKGRLIFRSRGTN